MDDAMKAILEVSLLFGQERDLDRLLQVVAEKAVEITGTSRGCVVLSEGTSLMPKAAVGMRLEEGEQVSRTIALEVLRAGEPKMWADLMEDARTAQAQSILKLQLRSAMCAPLAVGGKIHGVLYVDAQRTQFYEPVDLMIFQVLANHAAMAIENAQLIDALTGLYSAAVFYQQTAAEVQRYRQRGNPVSLILADLNGLKPINDHYGHLAGNSALVTLARSIRLHIRNSDIPCRYGGDEFAVILPGTGAAVAEAVLRRLKAACEEVSPQEVLGWQGAAFGLATCPDDGDTAEALISQADAGCYQDKQAHYAAQSEETADGEV